VASSGFRVSAASTTVAVDPSTTTVNAGDTFNVNVNVTNISNFTSWELKIYYLKSVLNCTDAVEGPFLSGPWGTYFNKTINNDYNSTHGRLFAYCTLYGMNSVNGSGVILTVTFKALNGGSTPLKISDTKLGDEKLPPQPIPHTIINGTVLVIGGVHDVAITEVTPLKTVVGQGCMTNTKIVITNQGDYTETVNFTIYINATFVTSQNVTVANGGTATIVTSWNTAGFAKGNYTLWAYARPVDGETDTGDNNCTDGIVKLTFQGDVTGDFKVNLDDITSVLDAFGSTRSADGLYRHGTPCLFCPHNPNNDVDWDGKVALNDITATLDNFGKTYP
jgi:hypothetical protein